jgi:hypothetical protein
MSQGVKPSASVSSMSQPRSIIASASRMSPGPRALASDRRRPVYFVWRSAIETRRAGGARVQWRHPGRIVTLPRGVAQLLVRVAVGAEGRFGAAQARCSAALKPARNRELSGSKLTGMSPASLNLKSAGLIQTFDRRYGSYRSGFPVKPPGQPGNFGRILARILLFKTVTR